MGGDDLTQLYVVGLLGMLELLFGNTLFLI